jgi:hypothetical protein
MPLINITVDDESRRRVKRELALVRNGAERAHARAINRTLTTVRKTLLDDLARRYFVKRSDASEKLKISQANRNRLHGYIHTKGKPIGLDYFRVTPRPSDNTAAKTTRQLFSSIQRRPRPKGGLLARVLRGGSGGRIAKAFWGTMRWTDKDGMEHEKFAVFQRAGKARFPLIRLHAPAWPSMLGKVATDEMQATAMRRYHKELDHEVARLLKGYGERA